MIFAPALVPPWLQLIAGLLMAPVLTGAAIAAPWRALHAAPERQHMLFGGLLALLLLWLMSIRVTDGLWIHLLGVTSLTLIVGWRLTVLGGGVVLCAHLALLGVSLLALPVAWVFSVALPATVTRLLVHALRRIGLQNLYVYLLGAGFGGGLASVLAMAVCCVPFLWLIGHADWLVQVEDNLPLIFLLAFPEGFINGMVVTAITVYFPDVVKTFDDTFYLGD